MNEKPWHAIAREYTGWLSCLMWPYRAYQWVAARNAKTPAPPTHASPRTQAKPRQQKVVEWHGFEGSGGIAVFLWGLGAFVPIFTYFAWKEAGSRPDTYWSMLSTIPIGAAFFIAGAMYYIANCRTIRWEDAPPGPNELPSSHHTKLASEHMRVALANYKEMFDLSENHLQIAKLGLASDHLARARKYDPGANVVDKEPEKKGLPPQTYTQDDLAALMLFLESDLYFKQADAALTNRMNAFDNSYESKLKRKRYSEEERATLKQALIAIEKALRYQSTNTHFLCHQAKIYNLLQEPKKAAASIQRAYEIDPEDVDVLKMKLAR